MASVPKSTYYRSGSSHPRFKKPAASVLAKLRVARVTRHSGRQWQVDFTDGVRVVVHQGENGGYYYAMRAHDAVRYYEEARKLSDTEAKAYEYAALTKVVPHQSAFHLQPNYQKDPTLIADVHDDLRPYARDARPRTASATRARRRRS